MIFDIFTVGGLIFFLKKFYIKHMENPHETLVIIRIHIAPYMRTICLFIYWFRHVGMHTFFLKSMHSLFSSMLSLVLSWHIKKPIVKKRA